MTAGGRTDLKSVNPGPRCPGDHDLPIDAGVLLIAPRGLLSDCLAVALGQSGWQTTSIDDNSVAAVERAAVMIQPGVAILDIDVPDAMTMFAPLCQRRVAVLVLTDGTDRCRLAEALEAGATGVIEKGGELLLAVRMIADALGGHLTFPVAMQSQLLVEVARDRAERRDWTQRLERLTPRERQVLAYLIAGRSSDEIAQARVVSIATVRTQIQNILGKLEVNSQLAAVALAARAGWEPLLGDAVALVAAG